MTSPNLSAAASLVHARTTCRGCESTRLTTVLDLGEIPLVNALAGNAEQARSAPRFPLILRFCAACFLVQLEHDVDPSVLFRHYAYFSSISTTMIDHVRGLVEEIVLERDVQSVVEIASNDGYLLQFYRNRGIEVLGIEPADNVAAVAQARGIPTLNRFFSRELGMELAARGIAPSIIHAHNTLAHVPDPRGFLAGISAILAHDGQVCIEVPHVVPLVERGEFDTIYHEHYSYFSLTTLVRLMAEQGLTITRAREIPIHGGSLQIFAQRTRLGVTASNSVREILERERAFGIDRKEAYEALGASARAVRQRLRELVADAAREGKRIAAYGASAKGCVAQNYAALTDRDIAFVVDKSPHKQGHWVPGTGQPILAPDELLARMPDVTLLTVWNLRDEIMNQESEYRRRGGRFIVPSVQPNEASQ